MLRVSGDITASSTIFPGNGGAGYADIDAGLALAAAGAGLGIRIGNVTATLDVAAGQSFTVEGAIVNLGVDPGNLLKRGAGTNILNGACEYTGTTIIKFK